MAPIPAFDSAIIIMLSVLLPAVCWLGIHKAGSPNDRSLVSSISAVLLTCWVLAALTLCLAGAFAPSAPKLLPSRCNAVPLLGAGMLIFFALFLSR